MRGLGSATTYHPAHGRKDERRPHGSNGGRTGRRGGARARGARSPPPPEGAPPPPPPRTTICGGDDRSAKGVKTKKKRPLAETSGPRASRLTGPPSQATPAAP